MIVYKDYFTFTVLGQEINLILNETDYGQSIVAEINDKYYYLGDDKPNIGAAILAWQQVNGRDLNDDEFRLVLIDNHIICNGI